MLPDISFNIDFFSGVFDASGNAGLIHPYYAPLWTERKKGLLGYNLAWIDDATGFIRAINTDRVDMGLFITGGGQALERLMEQTGEATRLHAAVHSGLDYARPSRIDLYLDVHDDGALAHRFKTLAQTGDLKTSARTIRFYHGVKNEQGCTTYLGAASGLRMIRIYDKKAESKGAIPHSRIEIQTRGAYARQLWDILCADASHENLKKTTLEAIRGVINWVDDPILEDVLSGYAEGVIPSRVTKDADVKAWLKRQVLPTFWKSFNEGDKDALMLWFVTLYVQMKGGRSS